MKSILRIYISSTLNVAAQYTEVLTVTLDLTPNISKQPTVHDQVIHNNIHRIIQYDLRALILTPYLRCVEEEEDYVLEEVHGGICSDHMGAKSLVRKIMRAGYFWPTM